jgi:hypothetical protein
MCRTKHAQNFGKRLRRQALNLLRRTVAVPEFGSANQDIQKNNRIVIAIPTNRFQRVLGFTNLGGVDTAGLLHRADPYRRLHRKQD